MGRQCIDCDNEQNKKLEAITLNYEISNLNNRFSWFINIIRQHLQEQKILYNEYSSSSGSHYFHIECGNDAHPCIRVSNHPIAKNSSHCINILYNIGLNTKKSRLRNRILSTVNNAINKSKTYSTNKLLNNLKKINLN